MKNKTGLDSVVKKPYNPLEKKHLAENIVRQLLESEVSTLPPVEPFAGAGIYVIYYSGDYPFYNSIAELNRNDAYDRPIYVGKAVPKGGRVGGVERDFDEAGSNALYGRLSEHAESITQVENLNIDEFRCRYLIIDELWIPLAESLLINRYRPIWNAVIKGFGNHDPGKGRNNQQPSPWDTLHPGRPWTSKLRGAPRDPGLIGRALQLYLKRYYPSIGVPSSEIAASVDSDMVQRQLDELVQVQDEAEQEDEGGVG